MYLYELAKQVNDNGSAYHDDCQLYLYHFETYTGPVEVLGYTEADALRQLDDMGYIDIISIDREVA